MPFGSIILREALYRYIRSLGCLGTGDLASGLVGMLIGLFLNRVDFPSTMLAFDGPVLPLTDDFSNGLKVFPHEADKE
jgi:hypothetical protein